MIQIHCQYPEWQDLPNVLSRRQQETKPWATTVQMFLVKAPYENDLIGKTGPCINTSTIKL